MPTSVTLSFNKKRQEALQTMGVDMLSPASLRAFILKTLDEKLGLKEDGVANE